MTGESYVVAGCQPWARRVFDDVLASLPGRWVYISEPSELQFDALAALKPRYLFFLHWSWKVPAGIVDTFECVNFHMTDLPYGRGGTPLQNLILGGHRFTRLSAIRMTDEIDAGPVYLKECLSLDGRAEEIYLRAGYLAAEMSRLIIERSPLPITQSGEVTVFRRRTPEESVIPEALPLSEVFDFIRMLDAEGYPHANFVRGQLHFEFREARAATDASGVFVDARVRITRGEESDA